MPQKYIECLCGCGTMIEKRLRKKYVENHRTPLYVLCLCGCGTTIEYKKRQRYIQGHKKNIEQLFKRKVIEDHLSGCWTWQGKKTFFGYGTFQYNKQRDLAHRMSFKIFKHPKGMDNKVIRHKCDNPKCVNPEHLEAGSIYDNINDMISRKRNAWFKGEMILSDKILEVKKMFSTGNFYHYQIAKMVGIHQSTVSRIINGKYDNRILNENKLREVFDIAPV